jgi:hypothetical protein
MALVRQKPGDIAEQLDALQQIVRDHRQHHVELEVAGLAAYGNGGVVTNDLSGYHGGCFRYDRIDLAGHDAASRLQRRQLDFTNAGEVGLNSSSADRWRSS